MAVRQVQGQHARKMNEEVWRWLHLFLFEQTTNKSVIDVKVRELWQM